MAVEQGIETSVIPKVVAALVATALLLAGPSTRAEGDVAYGEHLSAECVTCHQRSGADRGIPSIVGWPTDAFIEVLNAYKNRARPHQVMQAIARGLGDEEMAALAAYFASLDPQ